ncbi:hypothetical protein DM828_06420 [Pseudomonas umsongensis]|nr:hypothetical protein [Pseudomonas umsongensis]
MTTDVDPCRVKAWGRCFWEYISIAAVTVAYGFALTATPFLIVPTLCVGMPPGTLRVPLTTR